MQTPSTESKPGDDCGENACGGWCEIYSSHVHGACRVQFMRCHACRRPMGKRIVPVDSVPKRLSTTNRTNKATAYLAIAATVMTMHAEAFMRLDSLCLAEVLVELKVCAAS